MPANIDLKTSFEFPPRLEPTAYHLFQKNLYGVIQRNGITNKNWSEEVTSFLYQAAHFYAAIEAGIILEWKSEYLPSLTVAEYDVNMLQDVGVVEWAGQQVIDWVEAQKHIPKVSSSGWLQRLTSRVFHLLN